MLDLKHKLFLGLAIAALAAAAWTFHVWIAEHDARMQAESAAHAGEALAASAQAQMKENQAQDAARAAQEAATLAAMQKLVGQIRTPQQIASWLPGQANVPQPITVNIPPATLANPAPAAVVSIPQADLPALRDQIEQCKECAVELGAAEAALASRDDQLKEAGAALSAKDAEIAAWKKASRGTFWSRTKSAAKFLAIGGAIGAGAICGSGHCK